MDTSDHIIIPLTRGYSTVIDAIDIDLIDLKWTTQIHDGKYYACRHIYPKGKQILVIMHRVILSRILNRDLLPNEYPDHIDGDGLNNRRDNLRLATHTQNMQNRKIHKNNKSGYKGVYQTGKSFTALIRVNKKKIYLGAHATPELAAAAYDEAAVKHFGEFAKTNKNTLG